MRISRIDNAVGTTWILTAVLFGASLWQLWRSLDWGRNSWQITEWLINFAGGFVRRGLPGEILLHLSGALGVPANRLAIGVSVIVYAAMLYLLASRTRGVFPFAVVASSLLMGAPALQDFIVRKDVLVVLLFAACVNLVASASRNNLVFLCFGFLCSLGVLIHESFAFVSAVPLMCMVAGRKSDGEAGSTPRYVRVASLGIFLLVPLFLVTVFKGDRIVADSIDASWQPLWNSMDAARDVTGPSGAAIQALSSDFSQSLANSATVLGSFSMGVYVPLAWLATIALCFWMLVQFLVPEASGLKGRLAHILVIQLACVSPLFLLGWDFGRWIFLWTSSSVVILTCREELSNPFVAPLRRLSDRMLATRAFSFRPRLWLLLFLGIPGCCWTVVSFLTSSPLGFVAALLKRSLTW